MLGVLIFLNNNFDFNTYIPIREAIIRQMLSSGFCCPMGIKM